MQAMVVEWAPFQLKAGVAEVTLLTESQRLQENFLSKRKGYVARELLRGANGRYVDLIWWESDETAQAAMAEAMTSEACAAYFSIMELDPAAPDGGVLHFGAIKRY